jgi:NADH-dependent peroxiredoxin subunit F
MKDVLIVGGGPAAMSAGVYAARRKLDIVLVTKEFGGHVSESDSIENYLGFKSISGMELAKKFEEHLREYEIEIIEDVSVEKVYQEGSKVIAELNNGKKIEAKTAIVASGSKRKKLNVPGEKEFQNKGLTYCAICDGPLFQGQNVAVVGGSNSGLKSALYLSKIAKKVYLLEFLEKIGGEQIMLDELKQKENVEIITKAKVIEIFGKKDVQGLKYEDLRKGKEKQIGVEGIAIEIGLNPNSGFVDVEKDKKGKIKVDDKMRTSSNRIFAVGDVNDKGWDQIAVAVGQGCNAALEIEKVIMNHDN